MSLASASTSAVPANTKSIVEKKAAAGQLTRTKVVGLVDSTSVYGNFEALLNAWAKNNYQKPDNIVFSEALKGDLQSLVLYTDPQSKSTTNPNKFDVLMIRTTCDYDKDWNMVNDAIFEPDERHFNAIFYDFVQHTSFKPMKNIVILKNIVKLLHFLKTLLVRFLGYIS